MKRELPILVLMAIPFAVLPFIWNDLPDVVPIHWNVDGEADRTAGKTVGLLLLPCISLAVYGLFWLIPLIDPKRKLVLQKKPLPALRNMLILVLTFLFFVTLGAMMEVDGIFGVRSLIPLGVVLMFLGLGNYLPSLQPNYFIGIRTPWTLQDADVWRKTHRLAGRLWVVLASGLLVAWALLPPGTFSRVLLVVSLVGMALIPVAYSFVLWFRTKRSTGPTDDRSGPTPTAPSENDL